MTQSSKIKAVTNNLTIKNNKKLANAGFTLMEVVISISLLSIASMLSVNVVANLLKGATKGQSGIELEQASNFVFLKLKNDLEKAYFVDYNADNQTLTIKKTNPSEIVTYSIEVCSNPEVSPPIECVKRNGSPLTYYSSDKFSVGVRKLGSSQYFNLVKDTSDPLKNLAINIVMEFYKPDVETLGNFSGTTLIDTTVVLPTQQ